MEEKTIGFQGSHKYKLLIAYKRIVYRFQADEIYEEGYIYTFVFCHIMVPSSGHCGLCAFNGRVVHLV